MHRLRKEVKETKGVVSNLVAEKNELHRKASVLSDKLKEAFPGQPEHRGRSRTKSFGEYSQSHQRRLKRKRVTDCELLMNWLHLEGFTPSKLEVLNNETGEMETICLAADVMGSDAHCATQEDFVLINMMLLIKDKYCISGRGYHEMASVCKEMPRHYKLKRRIKELNSLWNITPAPNGILGVQQSLEDRLFIRISRLLKTAPEDAAFKKDGTIRVKLSGDGTRIGKRLHVTNFTFTILDEGPIAHTSEGNHIE